MLGAIAGAFMLNIMFDYAYIPAFARIITQIISGTVIACSINKEDIIKIGQIARPFLILICGMLIVNLIAGFLIFRISDLDLLTSLMSAVPGGMNDVTIISAEMGGNAPKVALFQLIRSFTTIAIFPAMSLKMTGGMKKPLFVPGETLQPGNDKELASKSWRKMITRRNVINLLATLSVAACLGITGRLSGIPAGTLIFSMAGVIILKFTTGRAYIPLTAKRTAQVLAGAYIGSIMTRTELFGMKSIILPAIILVSLYCINCIITGYILHKKCGFDRREAMLGAMPAGVSDIALIANELGVQSANVVKMHLLRLLSVVTFFPQVMAFIVFLAP